MDTQLNSLCQRIWVAKASGLPTPDKERKRMDHLSDLQVLTTMVVECTGLCADMSNKEASGISAWY